MTQIMEKSGSRSKTTPDELEDGISASESGSCAHTCRRVKLNPREKISAWRSVGDCLPAGFPATGRSASCALESKASSWKRACRK